MKKILCFGDSNTWGFNPKNGEQFSQGVRWTSILKEQLIEENIEIIEEGLCGRTTIFHDRIRPNRKGIDTLNEIFERNTKIDAVVIMLGTNDCKAHLHNSAKDITKGMEDCIKIILKYVSPQNVILISPILLGKHVWKKEFDPEFNKKSVVVSKSLKENYRSLANKKGIHFLPGSDIVSPSEEDQEHMDEVGHALFAVAVREKIKQLEISKPVKYA